MGFGLVCRIGQTYFTIKQKVRIDPIFMRPYVSQMKPTYTSPANKEQHWNDRTVARFAIWSVIVQVCGLGLVLITIHDGKENNDTLRKALEVSQAQIQVSQTQNEILTKTLGEYRDSNKLLDKTLTASHVPMLNIRVTSIKKEMHGVTFSYILKNDGDSLANNIVAKWEINDGFQRKYDLTENIKYDSSTSYVYSESYSYVDNLIPINQILCLLPKHEQGFNEFQSDALDHRVYKAFIENSANLKGTFTYEDMFHHEYQTVVRIKYYDKQFPVEDMELSGYYLELQK